MPIKNRPKPTSAVPIDARRFSPPVSRNSMPRPMMGSANASMLSFKPMIATSQPVMVVPMLDPYTMPSARRMVRSPALTKPIVATVTALDDCTIAVIDMPAKMPCTGERVQLDNRLRRAGPAAALRPSVIMLTASRNSPRPPASMPAITMLCGINEFPSVTAAPSVIGRCSEDKSCGQRDR